MFREVDTIHVQDVYMYNPVYMEEK